MLKKLSLSLLAIAAVSALVMGGTFALFTATTSNTGNTFTAGTVSLGEPTKTSFTYTDLAPGDSGEDTYTITYTGSLNAYLGMDITVNPGGGAQVPPVQLNSLVGGTIIIPTDTTLLDCDGNNSMKVFVNDVRYTTNTQNVLITNGTSNTFAKNGVATIKVRHDFPSAAGNSCQDKTATVTIAVHAVQAKNNDGPNIIWN